MRVGYPARNLTLSQNTNHTLRLKNLPDAQRVMTLVNRNLSDLESIIRWNAQHEMGLFRIGQNLVPFASHPAFPYNWVQAHEKRLDKCGALAQSLGVRLSMHPGQFVVPASPDPAVRARSLSELRYSMRVLDLMDAQDGVVVLHVGGVYSDREGTRERMAELLSEEKGLLRYLALENDERLWNVEQTLEVADDLGVPMIVDSLHHALNPGELDLSEALSLAKETWKRTPHRTTASRQKIHISSQAPERRQGAHSEFVTSNDLHALLDAVESYSDLDLMVEAKASEKAALAVRKCAPI